MSTQLNSKKVVLVHGTHVVIPIMEKAIKSVTNRIEVYHILNELLLAKLLEVGFITPEIQWRFTQLIVEGAYLSPDIIIVTGSSFGPCVKISQKMVSPPIIRIDEKMAEEAVKWGNKIAIVATEKTTIKPTTSLIKKQADILKKTVSIETILCQGALDLLRKGENKQHDSIIINSLREHKLHDFDVIVLAQLSTSRVQSQVESIFNKKVFSSLNSITKIIEELIN